jgi:hypothetical protein
VLTLFIPKAFRGQIGIIQRNAIESWKHLRLQPEILLLVNDAAVQRSLPPFCGDGDFAVPVLLQCRLYCLGQLSARRRNGAEDIPEVAARLWGH